MRGELDRLVAAVASGVESPTIAGVIGEREKRLAEVRARLEVIAVAPSVLDLEVRRLEKEARARLADFQALLGRNVAESRTTLEALLTGPLRFTPVQTKDGRRYEISGAAAIGALCTTDCVPKGIRMGARPPRRSLNTRFRRVATRHRTRSGVMAHPKRWGWAMFWPRLTSSSRRWVTRSCGRRAPSSGRPCRCSPPSFERAGSLAWRPT